MSTLSTVITNDKKEFIVAKHLLRQCSYFKTLFETNVGKEVSKDVVSIDCDGESFAILFRLLKYGTRGVLAENIPNNVKWILFNDANFLGFPLSLMTNFFVVKEEQHVELVNSIKDNEKQGFFNFRLPRSVINIDSTNFELTLSACLVDREKLTIEGVKIWATFQGKPLKLEKDLQVVGIRHVINIDLQGVVDAIGDGDISFQFFPKYCLGNVKLQLSYSKTISYAQFMENK